MYQGMTIFNNIITGIYDRNEPFRNNHFADHPTLSAHTLVLLPNGAGQYKIGTDIRCYDEEGVRKPDVWCIEQGYMPMPPGHSIENGELVSIDMPVEEASPTFRQLIDQGVAQAQAVSDRRFVALKPIIADLLKDREADVVIRLKEFLPEWSKRVWERGQSLIRNDYPYKVVQTHDSTEQEGWEPELYQAGFAPWHGRSPDTALPYIKPRHGEENYLPGEYMMWEDGLIYLSQRSTNFSPIEYPNDWYVQKEDGSFGPINAEQPEEPEGPVDPPEEPEDPPVELNRNGTVVWSEWVDMWALYPGVWEKQFQIGDRVTHLGKRKISEIDNNTYEPIDANWSAWRDAKKGE